MQRILLERTLFLAPAIALLAMISLAAPAHAQTASCDVLSGNAGPAWNPGYYTIGNAESSRIESTNYTSGGSGSDSAAQSACQSFSQANALSGVCQDQYSYVQSGYYIDPGNPDVWECQFEICANVTDVYDWYYNFYPNVNSITYSPPTSYNADTYDGYMWHYPNNGNGQSDAGVCTYTPPPQPPQAYITVNPGSIIQGQGTTLSWGSTNASSCTGTNFSTGGAASGAGVLYPSTTTSYWVTCYGPGGSSVAGTTVYVTPLPDIATAGLPTLTLTAGTSYPFAGTVYNVGAGNAGGFWNTLRICTNGCTPYDDHSQEAWIGGLGSGASTGITITDTVPTTPGSYYYIFYSDYNTAFAPTIADSNYNNNAASWGVLNVVQADLVSGTPPNLTLAAGQSYSFTSSVTNVGNGATTAGFWNVLRICSNSCTPYDDHSQQVPLVALGAGASSGVGITGTAPTTPGQYYYQIYPNNNTAFQNTVTESNYANDYTGPWASLVVVEPDLTVGSAPTVTVTLGQSIPLTGTVINQGTGGTGAGFHNIFVTNLNGAGTAWDTIQDSGVAPALGSGASEPISTTLPANTFSAPGTYQYDYCTDFNASWASTITESNENNNCVAGTIVVNPATPSCSLSANPSSLSPNQSTMLTWSSTNTTSCTGSGFSTGGAANGSTSVTPGTLPTSYGLSCTGGGGTCNATPATLSNSCAVGSLSMTMTVPSTLVPSGTNVTFNWTASNVQGSSCSVVGSDGYSQTVPTSSCAISGSNSVSVTHQTTYTITCDGTSKAVTVNVPPGFQEF